MNPTLHGRVVNVSLSPGHGFSKHAVAAIRCLKGEGVEGDAHCGKTVKHRSRVAADPSQPNLRQVHLIPNELLRELTDKGFDVAPGALGENVTTSGLDLLNLPRDSLLLIGEAVILRVTGLRNPCGQIEAFRKGLLQQVVARDQSGNLVRKAGIMAIVEQGGVVDVGSPIRVLLPDLPHHALERV